MRGKFQTIAAVVVLTLAAAAGYGAEGKAVDKLAAKEALDDEGLGATPQPVGVTPTGTSLTLQPRVPGVATSVYISCNDGTYIHKEFEGVGTNIVELAHPDGSFVADGRCKYEVLIHPAVDYEAIRLAEENGDDATLERLSQLEQELTVKAHGRFTVAGGAVVAPSE